MNEHDVAAEPRWKRVGPPYELTRDEFVSALQEIGVQMTERQLKSWESYRVLPVPERRVPPGVEEKEGSIRRALYPEWMRFVVRDLLQEVTRGATITELKQIAPHLISYWREHADNDSLVLPSGSTVPHPPVVLQGAAKRTLRGGGALTSKGNVVPRVSRTLQRAAWSYAARFAESNSTQVTGATLTLRRDDGAEVSIVINPISEKRSRFRGD